MAEFHFSSSGSMVVEPFSVRRTWTSFRSQAGKARMDSIAAVAQWVSTSRRHCVPDVARATGLRMLSRASK